MSWINRCAARIGSAAAVAAIVTMAVARAGTPPPYVFDGMPLRISHLETVGGTRAIAINDPGLAQLLDRIGGTITWRPGERYVLFMTAQPQIVSFAIGDRRYDVGALSAQASIAPYSKDNTAFVPLDELLRAFSLAPKRDGGEIVLQPQLSALDVRETMGGVRIVAQAGTPLHPHEISQTADRLIYEFDGVGTTLQRLRNVGAAGVRALEIAQSGTVREPVTTLTVDLAAGAWRSAPGSDDGRNFTLAISPTNGAPAVTAVNMPPPAPPGSPSLIPSGAPNASVSAVTENSQPDGFVVDISVDGSATFNWHRLRSPDDRFWIDINGAQLQMPPRDDAGSDPVSGVRVRQIDAQTVRVAVSLNGPKPVDVVTTPTGLRLVVHPEDAGDSLARSGSGGIGGASVAEQPLGDAGTGPAPPPAWKFTARPPTYAPNNPRLIVIDPGHGGSDPGTSHGGLREASLTLDMAKRLRDILTTRGWQVQLTRTGDADVFGAYASAHQELQARDDVANQHGARLLVSIHVNGYMNSGPNGTTTYYSKAEDMPLARAVQHRAVEQLGTTDDGIIKSKLYVTLHANMPAVLIETAFLTNPDDFARLASADWRQRAAKAIADGIGDYAGAPPTSRQPTDQ